MEDLWEDKQDFSRIACAEKYSLTAFKQNKGITRISLSLHYLLHSPHKTAAATKLKDSSKRNDSNNYSSSNNNHKNKAAAATTTTITTKQQ